ncbi:general secretion pathway protein GspN [Dyella jejuensis]|uniref:General secretion pathway protein GspN n=1 Tax=Dyella jejuensis TaxID=1432009 RepID=A0ABW8JFQ5_9GAMM
MNAAAQRRLTPAFAIATAVFGIALLLLLFGVGRGVTWNPPRSTPPLPAAHSVPLPTPPPLQSYAQVWEHPLFSADRKPIVTNGGGEGVSLGDLQLTGIILTPALHMALLGPAHDKGDNNKDDDSQEVRVREGTTLPDSNWKLIKVLPRSAVFTSPTGRTELKLPAGAPIDQPASSTSPGAMPMNNQGQGVAHPGNGMRGAMMQPMPAPVRPNDAQAERLQKLRAAILKQRSQQAGNAQGEH